ncbi:uncharacterized protein Dvar_78460 [Desulfosarcina variabilis str. Montpellier]
MATLFFTQPINKELAPSQRVSLKARPSPGSALTTDHFVIGAEIISEPLFFQSQFFEGRHEVKNRNPFK